MGLGGTRVERPAKYQFGEFEFFPNQGALWRSGVRVPLMPKPLATLLVLVILFEPAGIYGRWLTVKRYFEHFPLSHRVAFRRQRSYTRTDRLR